MKQVIIKDKLDEIAYDLKALCNIMAMIGNSTKELQVQEYEMYHISFALEKLANDIKEIEQAIN